jgi:hypothetical protein
VIALGTVKRNYDASSVAVKVAGAPTEVKISLLGSAGGGYVVLTPAILRAGTAKLAGRSYRVQVVDADLDGRYESSFPQKMLRAWNLILAMDLNGNGRLETDTLDSGEIMPLPKLIQVGGAWYDVAVAAEVLWGSLRGARLNVDVNLASLKDEGLVSNRTVVERRPRPLCNGWVALVNVTYWRSSCHV